MATLKVTQAFRDKNDTTRRYEVGEIIVIEDKDRVKDMLSRNLVVRTRKQPVQ